MIAKRVEADRRAKGVRQLQIGARPYTCARSCAESCRRIGCYLLHTVHGVQFLGGHGVWVWGGAPTPLLERMLSSVLKAAPMKKEGS